MVILMVIRMLTEIWMAIAMATRLETPMVIQSETHLQMETQMATH